MVYSLNKITQSNNFLKLSVKKYDIKIIVITNSASSTAAKMSDLALTYYMPSTKNGDFYSSATQVPVLYIIESIANLFIEYGIY